MNHIAIHANISVVRTVRARSNNQKYNVLQKIKYLLNVLREQYIYIYMEKTIVQFL